MKDGLRHIYFQAKHAVPRKAAWENMEGISHLSTAAKRPKFEGVNKLLHVAFNYVYCLRKRYPVAKTIITVSYDTIEARNFGFCGVLTSESKRFIWNALVRFVSKTPQDIYEYQASLLKFFLAWQVGGGANLFVSEYPWE